MRFESLYAKIDKKKSMNRQTDMLHLLLLLSGDQKNQAVVDPLQGSVLESAFN